MDILPENLNEIYTDRDVKELNESMRGKAILRTLGIPEERLTPLIAIPEDGNIENIIDQVNSELVKGHKLIVKPVSLALGYGISTVELIDKKSVRIEVIRPKTNFDRHRTQLLHQTLLDIGQLQKNEDELDVYVFSADKIATFLKSYQLFEGNKKPYFIVERLVDKFSDSMGRPMELRVNMDIPIKDLKSSRIHSLGIKFGGNKVFGTVTGQSNAEFRDLEDILEISRFFPEIDPRLAEVWTLDLAKSYIDRFVDLKRGEDLILHLTCDFLFTRVSDGTLIPKIIEAHPTLTTEGIEFEY